MEHQVFVPVPADLLRTVLRDPAGVARCVPGLQQDAEAGAEALAGRLKVRVGGHSVTYRGALTLTERDPDRFSLDGAGTEVRGSGKVTLSVALRLTPEEGGTRIGFTTAGTAEGRAAGFAAEASATAVRRLLERGAEQLAAVAAAAADPVDPVAEGEAEEAAEAAAEEAAQAEGPEGPGGGADDADTGVTASVFETDVPPPSLDPFLASEADLPDGPPRPPAEAAHARRTMIGRSAEEVDHAPPRGRYAPVPAPAAATAGESLRWIAPAAALALASAVVLGRALRRRR